MRRDKHPAILFYTRDHLADGDLVRCSLATQGAWVRWLLHMHLADDFQVSGTAAELARLASCTPKEALEAAQDLHSKGAADVTFSGPVTDPHTIITITSRRLRRESTKRKSDRERKMRQRVRERTCPVTHRSRNSHNVPSSSLAASPPPDPPPSQEAPLLTDASVGSDGSDGGGKEGASDEKQQELRCELEKLGVTAEKADEIVRTGDHEHSGRQVERYRRENAWRRGHDRAPMAVGVLVKCCLNMKEIGLSVPESMTQGSQKPRSPAEGEALHEVEHHCRFCRTTWTSMSDQRYLCPRCGATAYEQYVPELVEKGMLPRERLETLPRSAAPIADGMPHGKPHGRSLPDDSSVQAKSHVVGPLSIRGEAVVEQGQQPNRMSEADTQEGGE